MLEETRLVEGRLLEEASLLWELDGAWSLDAITPGIAVDDEDWRRSFVEAGLPVVPVTFAAMGAASADRT